MSCSPVHFAKTLQLNISPFDAPKTAGIEKEQRVASHLCKVAKQEDTTQTQREVVMAVLSEALRQPVRHPTDQAWGRFILVKVHKV